MDTGLVAGITPHLRDAEIVKSLAAAKRKLGGSTDAVIAFKNTEGRVYRRAVLNGIHQEMYLAERLGPLGLVDESDFAARKPRGVWTCFGPKRDMALAAMLEELQTGVRPLVGS